MQIYKISQVVGNQPGWIVDCDKRTYDIISLKVAVEKVSDLNNFGKQIL